MKPFRYIRISHSIEQLSRKYRFLIMVLTMSVPCLTGSTVYAIQDESKAEPDLFFSCTQNEKEFILKARMSHWTGERDVSVNGALIVFSNQGEEDSRQLDVLPTDMNGEAELRIDKVSERLISRDGYFAFSALFEGNLDYEPSEDMAEVKPLTIHLDFIEIDSVKTIVAQAFELDQEGNPDPLDATDVYFFVPRSFSLLPVGDGWFEEGRAQLDFPTSLPGDSVGNLTIIAKIEDHELYGNVEAVAVKDWGLAVPRVVIKKRRGLGDTDAPLWMVYTLIVLLSIVWFHYLYVFFVMLKIKRLRRN